jgi:hypothetical protein
MLGALAISAAWQIPYMLHDQSLGTYLCMPVVLPRSQLQLAAEMLPRHISAPPRRLDYMQQLLGLEELPVVERCELAAHLLLSLRGDLRPSRQIPMLECCTTPAWWSLQVWLVPEAEMEHMGYRDAYAGDMYFLRNPPQLLEQLKGFIEAFLKLAAKVSSAAGNA